MIKYNVPCYIQARLSSSRLPGKVLLMINNNHMISILINRLQTQGFKPYLLTTESHIDNTLVDFVNANFSVPIYRGSEQNVRARFLNAMIYFGHQNCFRLTADNPYTSIRLLSDLSSKLHKADNMPSYLTHEKSTCIEGTRSEFFTKSCLVNNISHYAADQLSIEHVTYRMYDSATKKEPDYMLVRNPFSLSMPLKFSITVDTASDFKLLHDFVQNLKPSISRKLNSGFLDVDEIYSSFPTALSIRKDISI